LDELVDSEDTIAVGIAAGRNRQLIDPEKHRYAAGNLADLDHRIPVAIADAADRRSDRRCWAGIDVVELAVAAYRAFDHALRIAQTQLIDTVGIALANIAGSVFWTGYAAVVEAWTVRRGALTRQHQHQQERCRQRGNHSTVHSMTAA